VNGGKAGADPVLAPHVRSHRCDFNQSGREWLQRLVGLRVRRESSSAGYNLAPPSGEVGMQGLAQFRGWSLSLCLPLLQLALGLFVGWVHSPAATHPTLSRPKGLIQQRRILEHPAVETGMVDLNASFFHHLLKLAVADRVRHIPAHTPKGRSPAQNDCL
jgi:hypothetical protein